MFIEQRKLLIWMPIHHALATSRTLSERNTLDSADWQEIAIKRLRLRIALLERDATICYPQARTFVEVRQERKCAVMPQLPFVLLAIHNMLLNVFANSKACP